MFAYVWPIALVVLSNIVYHVCTKSVPSDVNPFASLTVTYAIGALAAAAAFFLTGKGVGFFREIGKANWSSCVLGLVILGLEAGFIYAYKAGWQVSTASIVQCAFLTIALIFVGHFLYQESLSWNKLIGIALAIAGLIFINMK